MKNARSTRVVGIALAAGIGLTGCTAAPAAAPAPVEVQEPADQLPPAPHEVTEMHGQRAEVYGTLASITHDAEHIVIARVVNQSGQPPNYDLLPITQSTIEVVEVLKGKWAPGDQRTIFDIGNSTVLMDHTAAPVKVGTTYLLFLVSMGKWDKRDGKAIDGKNIFTSVLPAHFYVAGDTYTLDEPSIPDTVPRTFTRAELQAVLKKK